MAERGDRMAAILREFYRSTMRHVHSTVVLLLSFAAAATAQQPRVLTANDYARAEQFLGANTFPLVTGQAGPPTWLDDGRFWYRVTTRDGGSFVLVDAARARRTEAFDHTRLASALAAASGAAVNAARMQLAGIEYSKDGRSIELRASGRQWQCSLQQYTCAPADTSARPYASPPNSATSPDGNYAAFIRNHNLWVKDLRSGADIQLTTDGVEDFGYATNNAGWIKSPAPVLLWSPDSRRIATFQHDGRGVGKMHLVRTTNGEPVLESWRYPLPKDSVIFRIHRVIIDVPARKLVRLQM